MDPSQTWLQQQIDVHTSQLLRRFPSMRRNTLHSMLCDEIVDSLDMEHTYTAQELKEVFLGAMRTVRAQVMATMLS